MATLNDLLNTLPLLRAVPLDPRILAMPVGSVCGKDCVDVLRKGEALASACPDMRDTVLEAVARQVNIFYFG